MYRTLDHNLHAGLLGHMDQHTAKRVRARPDMVVGDKGYSSERVRLYLRDCRVVMVIPTKADTTCDRAAYAKCNEVERLIKRLKPWRRIATRYEKRATNHRAMLTIAAILQWS